MSVFQEASAAGLDLDVLVLDRRTESLLERRRSAAGPARRRGWFVRRALLAADAAGLILAYLLAKLVVSAGSGSDPWVQFGVLLLALPLWVVAAKLYGLYDRDEERTDHSTTDEVVGVFHLVTVGAWLRSSSVRGSRARASPHVPKLILFWAARDRARASARGRRRARSRRRIAPTSRTRSSSARATSASSIARKLLQHPEYGVNLVGFVDAHPKPRRRELEHARLLGPPSAPRDRLGARHRARDRRVLRTQTTRNARARSASCARPRRPDRRRAAPVRDRRSERRASTRSRVSRSSGCRPRRLSPSSRLAQARDRLRRRAPRCSSCSRRSSRVDRARGSGSTRRGPVLLPAAAARTRHARVHGAQVPHDDGRHGSGGAPAVHREHADARRLAERERAVQARPLRLGHPRRPLAPARRASTSCRSSSTSCAATCRSSGRDRASPTRPSTSGRTTSSASSCRRA